MSNKTHKRRQVAPNIPSRTTRNFSPKYLSPRFAAEIYGVHRDFFRKNAELRRYRVVLNAKTHLYPVDALDAFFSSRMVG